MKTTWETGQKISRPLLAEEGFTLIEVMISLVLVGFLIGLAVPTFNSLAAVKLKNSANQMQGLFREIYSLAALSGTLHRLVINFDDSTYVVESEIVSEKGDKDNLLLGPVFKPVAGELGAKNRLERGVYFYAAWVAPMKEKVREGQAVIQFYAGGFTDKAFITLTDNDEGTRVLSVVTEPLTGESYIEETEPPIEE